MITETGQGKQTGLTTPAGVKTSGAQGGERPIAAAQQDPMPLSGAELVPLIASEVHGDAFPLGIRSAMRLVHNPMACEVGHVVTAAPDRSAANADAVAGALVGHLKLPQAALPLVTAALSDASPSGAIRSITISPFQAANVLEVVADALGDPRVVSTLARQGLADVPQLDRWVDNLKHHAGALRAGGAPQLASEIVRVLADERALGEDNLRRLGTRLERELAAGPLRSGVNLDFVDADNLKASFEGVRGDSRRRVAAAAGALIAELTLGTSHESRILFREVMDRNSDSPTRATAAFLRLALATVDKIDSEHVGILLETFRQRGPELVALHQHATNPPRWMVSRRGPTIDVASLAGLDPHSEQVAKALWVALGRPGEVAPHKPSETPLHLLAGYTTERWLQAVESLKGFRDGVTPPPSIAYVGGGSYDLRASLERLFQGLGFDGAKLAVKRHANGLGADWSMSYSGFGF